MTIDERLEDIATLQQTHDEQISRLFEKADQTENMIRVLGERMGVLTERTIQAMDAISRLARIADNHEDRIEDLEGPKQ